MKTIFLSMLMIPFIVNALSYQDTVMAFEEALENQSAYVYQLKCQREDERNLQVRESYERCVSSAKQKEIDRIAKETNERLDRY